MSPKMKAMIANVLDSVKQNPGKTRGELMRIMSASGYWIDNAIPCLLHQGKIVLLDSERPANTKAGKRAVKVIYATEEAYE